MFDIIIVQKKSDVDSHCKTRESLISLLNSWKFSFQILTLDEIYEQKIPYFHSELESSGFFPHKNLVISLGGDGTLLHASHYVGKNIRLLGINSSPESSVGHMCALKPEDIAHHLKQIIEDENNFKKVQRLQICYQPTEKSSDKKADDQELPYELSILPLCLNDTLVCHEHPAETSRIQMSLYERKTQKIEQTSKVFSSGLWVSTVMGQTAAISSYGFPKEKQESDSVFVVVREPYFPKNCVSYPKKFQFHGMTKQLHIKSQMRGNGLICVDGPDSCAHFNLGTEVVFNTPEKAMLKLVL